MVFKFFLASICCLSLACCLLPNAREIVRDEQLVCSLSEKTKCLSLASSPGGLHPSKDELSQIQGVESEKQSDFQASSREWKESLDEINSLKKDSIELTKLIPDLRRSLDIRTMQAHQRRKNQRRAIVECSESVRILEDSNQKIDKLKQIRLAELGDVEMPKSHTELLADLLSQDSKGPAATAESSQSLRYDPLAKTSTDVMKNYGDGIVNDLKKVLAIGKSDKADWELLNHDDFFMLQQTAFKMIDFLIKNHFADPESVKKIFQEFDVVANVVRYVRLAFNRDMPHGWWITSSFGSHTTEHWYWKYLHADSFGVLSEREERNVNFYFLLETLREQPTIDPPLALFLKQSSLIDRLWARLEMSKATSITPPTVKKFSELARDSIRKVLRMHQKTDTNPPIGKKEISSQDFGKDFRTIMDFVMSYLDEEGPYKLTACHLLVSLLELTNKYLFPGILKEVMQNHPRSLELENRVELIQHMARISDLFNIVNSYRAIHADLVAKNSIAAHQRGNVLNNSLRELKDSLPEYLSILRHKNEDLLLRFKSFFDYYERRHTRAMEDLLQITPPRPFKSK